MEGDADGAGQVIVASTRGAQFAGSAGDKLFAREAGQDAEAFERGGDLRSLQTVEVMLALIDEADEVCGFQAL